MRVGNKRGGVRFALAETQALINCIIYYLQRREMSPEERTSMLAAGRRLKTLEKKLIQQRSQKHGK